MAYVSLGALFAAVFSGWIAGMFTYQRSRRWCTKCGTTLKCPACHEAAMQRATAPGEHQA